MPSFRTESGGPRASPYSTVKSIKGNTKARGDKEGKSGKMAYVYDKKLILTLVLKQANPDWETIASAMINKTKTKTYDTWRQGIYPSLIAGKPWCNASGASWTSDEKIELTMMVIQSVKIDWNDIRKVYPDRTKAQIYDVWRQSIVPRLKKGEPIL